MTKEAKILIAIAALVLVGGVLLAIFFNPQPQEPGQAVDSQSLIRESSRMTKQASAKVNIVEFGDYQCPACASAHPKLKEVMEFYKDKDVNLVWRNFPLETIHPNARIGSEAAEAAGNQGKYWEMHDVLYEHQSEWSVPPDPTNTLVSYATSLGLNADQFKVELSQHLAKAVIDADLKDGQSLGVDSTPTFYINGVKLGNGNVPTVEDFKKAIDEALAK